MCSVKSLPGGQSAEVIVEPEGDVCIAERYPVKAGTRWFPRVHRQCLQSADWNRLHSFLREATVAVRERCEPDGTNVDINNGPAAGQTVPHLHWHSTPRYEGDVTDPTGGVRGVIPEERTYD